MGWGGSEFFLAESQSRLYPHMRAKFGRDPMAVSKKVPFNFISRLFSAPRIKIDSKLTYFGADCSTQATTRA